MPTVIIPDKICSHCGGNKWSMKKAKNGNLHIRTCFNKLSENRKAWRASEKGKLFINTYFKTEAGKKHREKYCSKDSTRKLRARLAVNQYAKDKANNPEKVRENKRISSKKSVERLVDSVIKRYIAREYNDINYSDVPQDLIELKRKQLLLIRQIKNHESKKENINN
jgi:predicted metalloprotease